jgi:hypothetical protein
MTCVQAEQDPFYEEPAAQWLRDRFEYALDIEFNIDDRLAVPIAANRGLRALWVRPGLPFDDFQWLTGRAAMFIEFGLTVVPEFITPIESLGAVALAIVLPFQRRPPLLAARKN